MTIKNDKWIKQMAQEHKMIEPFVGELKRSGVISYGPSSYGYDIRLTNKFKIFTNLNTTVVDPKNFDPSALVEFEGDVCIIPPNSFVLAQSLEYIRMPRNVTGLVLGKSTYARCGIVANFTPLEAGWEGYITIEISNATSLPAKIYANEGFAQILFFEGEDCTVSYADRGGKYQGQKEITLPKVDNVQGNENKLFDDLLEFGKSVKGDEFWRVIDNVAQMVVKETKTEKLLQMISLGKQIGDSPEIDEALNKIEYEAYTERQAKEQTNKYYTLTGHVEDIDPSRLRMTLNIWSSGVIEIPYCNIPDWLSKKDALFDVTIPYEQRYERDLSKVNFLEFIEIGYDDLTDEQLLAVQKATSKGSM